MNAAARKSRIAECSPEQRRFQFEAFLEEYKQLRAEILSIQRAQRQLVGYSLTAAGIIVTLVVTRPSTADLKLISTLLFGVAFIYVALALLYLGFLGGILRLSKQIVRIAGKLRALSNTSSVIGWEQTVSTSFRGTIGGMLIFCLGAVGEFSLIIVPSFGVMALALRTLESFSCTHILVVFAYGMALLFLAIAGAYIVRTSRFYQSISEDLPLD